MPDDRAFYKAIASRSFERAYSIHGDEEFLKDEAVRQLLAAALDPATRDFNLDTRDAASVSAEALASLLATPPMMAERRVVVVRDAALLRKDVRAVVDHFLERPASKNADIILVIVYGPEERGKPDRSLVQRTFSLETEPLTGNRVPKWIVHHAQTALGVSVTDEAASLLFEHAGNDLAALAGELDKLASYTNGGVIDEPAVSAVVGVRRGARTGALGARARPAEGRGRSDRDGADDADAGVGVGAGDAGARNVGGPARARVLRAAQGRGRRVHRSSVGGGGEVVGGRHRCLGRRSTRSRDGRAPGGGHRAQGDARVVR